MEPEGLKSESLFENSRHNICSFCFSFNIFSNHLIVTVWCQSIIFSEMEPETLKSELLLEDSGHSICCFRSSFNIFSNQFGHYCLMSINYFLRNEARSSQKQTFARRQWAQHLLFFVLLPTSFPINLIIIVCCQSIFSQKYTQMQCFNWTRNSKFLRKTPPKIGACGGLLKDCYTDLSINSFR